MNGRVSVCVWAWSCKSVCVGGRVSVRVFGWACKCVCVIAFVPVSVLDCILSLNIITQKDMAI